MIGARMVGLAALAALLHAGCGDSDGDKQSAVPETRTEAAPTGPAATEASPGQPVQGPTPTGELSESDRAAVSAAVDAYIDALNRRDAAAACALFEPRALPVRELPRRRAGCARSLGASIGYARPGGTPVWERTTINELKEVSVGPDRARVTATVTHRFADRNYTSAEDDVIYLDRSGERWLLVKPSGTLYRAVGYPEPPLRALTPP
jgi:hypothetical protein